MSVYLITATSPYIDGKPALDKASEDYGEAIRLDPKDAEAYNSRGSAYEKKGEFGKAIEDYARLVELEVNVPRGYNAIGWIYATCSKDEFRNSAKAVDLAKKGCELSLWRDGGVVDTLAAAEAEAGQFDDAVRYEQQAISLIKDTNASADTKSMEDRVKLYKQHKPYRDTPE